MKFGREYKDALKSDDFPEAWKESAIDYRNLKKCIKKVRRELEELGLDRSHVNELSGLLDSPASSTADDAQQVSRFVPQLRLLVDARNGEPLDATLAPETREKLQKLASSTVQEKDATTVLQNNADSAQRLEHDAGRASVQPVEARWIQVPLHSAQDFFNLLGPRLGDLEQLNKREEERLEEQILDLGEAIENVTEPVREGFESKRYVSYRDLYFWREMFRLYMERPIFYAETEQNRGAITFQEAKKRLEAYDTRLRETGLLAKMRTPMAKYAADKFLKVNVRILRIMHFQEMNARAMTKILKKFDKQTNLEGSAFLLDLRKKHPALLTNSKNAAGGFANSIAKDLHAEISTKVLPIVPQLDDWTCPVCYAMAWRPVNLGCCRSVYCIRCIIKLQDDGMRRCPCCNKETVLSADGRNIDFPTMDFLEKYFPMEVKKRQKENETEHLKRKYGEEFVKPCSVM